MDAIQGTYNDGRIELDAPVSWPDGSRVTVIADREEFGMTEANWPKTPEEISAHIARMESREIPEMTPEEWDQWQKAREESKRYTLANMDKDIPRFDP